VIKATAMIVIFSNIPQSTLIQMDQCHATVTAARKRGIRHPLFVLLLDSIKFISDFLQRVLIF